MIRPVARSGSRFFYSQKRLIAGVMPHGIIRTFILATALVLLSLVTLSFVGAIPSAQAQPTPPPYDANTVPPPSQDPIALFGSSLYLENCAPCHGETGLGDGPTASELMVQPAPFADPALIWDRAPAELFHVTKYGRMENLMPPWRNQMTDQEIWDTVYYAWGLHTNQVEIEDGQQRYVQSCANCHGENGEGDGVDATEALTDLSDGAAMMVLSPSELNQRWNDAHREEGEEWTEAERRNVLNYIRTFTYAPPWESPYQGGDGVVEGAVIQATEGGRNIAEIADEIDVSLRAFIDFAEVEGFASPLDEQGRFRFENLAIGENVVYLLETTYDDVRYGSDFFRIDPQNPIQTLDLAVYDTSDDGSAVTMVRTNWVIDFEPGALVIGQIATFGNESDSTYIGTTVDGVDLPVTAALNIPENAEQVEFRDGELGVNFYQLGDTIYDTAPLVPGQETRQIVVSYRVPLEGDEAAVSQTLLYPVGEMNVLVADLDDIEAEITGVEFVQNDTIQGMPDRIWGGADLAAGEEIDAQISNALTSNDLDPRLFAEEESETSAVGPSQTAEPLDPMAAFIFGGLLVIGLAGVFVWTAVADRSAPTKKSPESDKDELIDRIAALDDEHARGEIDDESWSAQRAELKRALMDVARQLDSPQQG